MHSLGDIEIERDRGKWRDIKGDKQNKVKEVQQVREVEGTCRNKINEGHNGVAFGLA